MTYVECIIWRIKFRAYKSAEKNKFVQASATFFDRKPVKLLLITITKRMTQDKKEKDNDCEFEVFQIEGVETIKVLYH